jgi:hypothetical protein
LLGRSTFVPQIARRQALRARRLVLWLRHSARLWLLALAEALRAR